MTLHPEPAAGRQAANCGTGLPYMTLRARGRSVSKPMRQKTSGDRWALIVVLAISLLGVGCAPTPVVKYSDSPLLLAQFPPPSNPRPDAETDSVTLPPGANSKCTTGSFILGTGKNDRYANSSGLDCLGQAGCFVAVDQTAVVPPGTITLCAGTPSQTVVDAYVDTYTDHMVARTTKDGELVRVVLGMGTAQPPPRHVARRRPETFSLSIVLQIAALPGAIVPLLITIRTMTASRCIAIRGTVRST